MRLRFHFTNVYLTRLAGWVAVSLLAILATGPGYMAT